MHLLTILEAWESFFWQVLEVQFKALQYPIILVPMAAVGWFLYRIHEAFFGSKAITIIIVIFFGFCLLAWLPFAATIKGWERFGWFVVGGWVAASCILAAASYQPRRVVEVEILLLVLGFVMVKRWRPWRRWSRLEASNAEAWLSQQWACAKITGEWRRAARANGEKAGRVKSVTPTLSGWKLRIRLDRGRHAEDLKPERVASSFDGKADVIADPRSDLYATIRIRHHLPFTDPIPAPPPGSEPHRIPVGLDEDGDAIILNLLRRHLIAGGESRFGKTNTIRQVIGHYTQPSVDAILVILDGKHTDYRQAQKRCALYAGADTKHGAAILSSVIKELRARGDYIAAHGDSFYAMTDLPPEVRLPPILVVIDDISTFLDGSKLSGWFLASLTILIKQGLASDCHVVIGEQKPTGDALATGVRDICGERIGFRCTTSEMAKSILGADAADALTQLPEPPELHAGRCAYRADDGVRMGRTFLAGPEWFGDALAATPRRWLNGERDETSGVVQMSEARTGQKQERERIGARGEVGRLWDEDEAGEASDEDGEEQGRREEQEQDGGRMKDERESEVESRDEDMSAPSPLRGARVPADAPADAPTRARTREERRERHRLEREAWLREKRDE